MAAYKLDIQRYQGGSRIETNAVPVGAATAAEVNSALTRNPDHVHVFIGEATEAQVRGLLQYAQCIQNGEDTSTVESAIAALF